MCVVTHKFIAPWGNGTYLSREYRETVSRVCAAMKGGDVDDA
jgi:hypothetical protein